MHTQISRVTVSFCGETEAWWLGKHSEGPSSPSASGVERGAVDGTVKQAWEWRNLPSRCGACCGPGMGSEAPRISQSSGENLGLFMVGTVGTWANFIWTSGNKASPVQHCEENSSYSRNNTVPYLKFNAVATRNPALSCLPAPQNSYSHLGIRPLYSLPLTGKVNSSGGKSDSIREICWLQRTIGRVLWGRYINIYVPR